MVMRPHFAYMAARMLDSPIETTRVYWRRKYELPEHIVNDPRPLELLVHSMDMEKDDETA